MDAPFPAEMMPCIEQFFKEVHSRLTPGQDVYPEVFETGYFFPLQRQREMAVMMREARKLNPRVVMEIGADKGGSLYHWCMCLPTVKYVIACEIRGTPYCWHFSSGFPNKVFTWIPGTSRPPKEKVGLLIEPPIDILFIDGDKSAFLEDFNTYLPLMRRPGGLGIMHDVQDRGAMRDAYQAAIRQVGAPHRVIIDRSEGEEAAERKRRGIKPKNSYDGWLQHWEGSSCGYGLIYL